jgi:hypothetical protein
LLQVFSNKTKSTLILATGLFLFAYAVSSVPTQAQEKRPSQTAGVDNTKMGTYRALAELSFHAFQKGDGVTAAKLARILERAWDKSEEGGGEKALAKTNSQLFEQIDRAMDVFIKPLIGYEKATPDPAKVESAYSEYLELLKQAD